MMRSGEAVKKVTATVSERALAVGTDYRGLWRSHRFLEANIKAAAGGKGQLLRHFRTVSERE